VAPVAQVPPAASFAPPPVATVWAQPVAGEAPAQYLFEPLPLLFVPEISAAHAAAPTAEAGAQAGDRGFVRIALVLALAVLIGVAIYIVWVSR
jgi:hypothetical protein